VDGELLTVEVLTPAETLLEAAGVLWVQVRLADGGGIGIWPGHAPLVAETVRGELRYADGEGEHALALETGILRIQRNRVTLLVGPGAPDQEPLHIDRLVRLWRGGEGRA
jgi:F0F1-type ATP synthase epsilon subunit